MNERLNVGEVASTLHVQHHVSLTRTMRVVTWVLPAIVLVPMIFYPLDRDPATYAYAGQVIADGGLLYRDVFDAGGPLRAYTYAMAIASFGLSEIAVRFVFYLIANLSACLVAQIGGQLAGPSARLPSALCYALFALQAAIGILAAFGVVLFA